MDLLHDMNERGMTIVWLLMMKKLPLTSERVIHLLDGRIEQVQQNGKHRKLRVKRNEDHRNHKICI